MEHLITAVVTLLVGVLVLEFYAWLPGLRKWLIRIATCLAPEVERNRLFEQWAADLDEMPNSAIMLFTSLGFFVAAARLNIPRFNKATLIAATRYVFVPTFMAQCRFGIKQINFARSFMQRDIEFLDSLDENDLIYIKCEVGDISWTRDVMSRSCGEAKRELRVMVSLARLSRIASTEGSVSV